MQGVCESLVDLGLYRGCFEDVSTVIPTEMFFCAAALAGAMVGSFLNVCIYRLPRDMSVNRPARSFCPGCRRTIPWFENIPVLSWLLLRGKCSGCGVAISQRYLWIELLTAALFTGAAWGLRNSDPWLLIPQAAFVSLLLVATFVDLEHMIIPDEVTWGGVGAGLVCALAWPGLHAGAAHARVAALGLAALGAGVGYGLLWAVAEVGRLAFGRQRFRFDPPTELVWTRSGETAALQLEEDTMDWSELFPRGTEQVQMEVVGGRIDGAPMQAGTARWGFESLSHGPDKWDLNSVNRIACSVQTLVLPREVMGFGDVKFLAAIGAFTGWRGVIFSLMAACCSGALLGGIALVSGKREWSSRIPFGPYLALGALLWLAVGPECWSAYWALLLPTGG